VKRGNHGGYEKVQLLVGGALACFHVRGCRVAGYVKVRGANLSARNVTAEPCGSGCQEFFDPAERVVRDTASSTPHDGDPCGEAKCACLPAARSPREPLQHRANHRQDRQHLRCSARCLRMAAQLPASRLHLRRFRFYCDRHRHRAVGRFEPRGFSSPRSYRRFQRDTWLAFTP